MLCKWKKLLFIHDIYFRFNASCFYMKLGVGGVKFRWGETSEGSWKVRGLKIFYYKPLVLSVFLKPWACIILITILFYTKAKKFFIYAYMYVYVHVYVCKYIYVHHWRYSKCTSVSEKIISLNGTAFINCIGSNIIGEKLIFLL